jgi:hypothetical protein
MRNGILDWVPALSVYRPAQCWQAVLKLFRHRQLIGSWMATIVSGINTCIKKTGSQPHETE